MKKLLLGFVLSALASGFVFCAAATVNAQGDDSGEFMLEEIRVTANRVESLASKTPIAVSAVTGNSVTQEGLTDPTSLENMVPDLSIVCADGLQGLQITIRGVTSSDGTEKGDPSAAFMVDDIYIARPQFHAISFYDLERVEVLRGPQGTLYGRNTTAGVVNVITNKPKNDVFESTFNVTAGNYGTILGDGMVNVPVSEKLAFRAAISYQRRDSYIELANSTQSMDPYKDNFSVRLQALFDFNDDASLLLKGDYSSLQGRNWSTVGKWDGATSTLWDMTDPQNPRYNGSRDSDEMLTDETIINFPLEDDNKALGISSELNWGFGSVALTYLASYHQFDRDFVGAYSPFNPAIEWDFTGDYWQTMQEIRLATTGDGPFQGQTGVYYFKEESGIALYLYDGWGLAEYGFPQDPTINESLAYYGQGTYSLTPDLRLTAGIRYSDDSKSRKGATNIVFYDESEIWLVNDAEKTFTKTTWRLGLDYDLNDKTLLYGSVATGYKAGGFNDGCDPNNPDCNQPNENLYYEPENLLAYEIGVKTKFSDKVVLNGTAFYYDYDNLQLSEVVSAEGGGSNLTTINAAKAEVKGVEIESVLMPTSRNRINVNLAWLDATYSDYSPGIPQVDYSGKALDRSPEFTASLGYRYRHPLSNGGSIEGALDFHWSDSFVLSNYSVPVQFEQPSYHKTNLSLTYTNPDGSWYFQVFGKNLEDEITLSGAQLTTITPGDPRTYGVRTGIRF